MDTSETFMKMSDCPEIQAEWKPTCGDWHWHFACNEEDDHADVIDYDEIDTVDGLEHIVERSIWLPRQDQLQEMVCDTLEEMMFMPTRFYWGEQDWYHVTTYAEQFTSMEQLWLAFVIKEKYNKTWDGGEWGG